MRSAILFFLLFATSCVDAQTKLYDPSWFDDGSLETDEQWALVEGHAVLFFAWAVTRDLVANDYPHRLGNGDIALPDGQTASESVDNGYAQALRAIRNRAPDALGEAVWLVENGMSTRDFSPEGSSFAASCFSTYRRDFPKHLGLPEEAGIRATWERYDQAAPWLDALLGKHKAGGCA